MHSYILALDQGTTSSRAMVFDRAGAVVTLAQQEFTQHFPQPGWVEHDAMDIWRSQLAVARQTLAQQGLQAQDIAAIGITNQRKTTVLWDRKTGQPVAPAIVWQDRRTAARCDALRAAGKAALIQKKPAWCWTPIFPPPSWPGCWTTCRVRAAAPSAVTWPLAPWTAGCCGT